MGLCRFTTRKLCEKVPRRKSDDEKRNNSKRDYSSRKRIMCMKCQEKVARTTLSGWSKQLCTTCAKKEGCSFPKTRIMSKRRRDRSSMKRTICTQCQEKRALTNVSGWGKQLCTKCAKENGCSFPLMKILNNNRKVNKEPVAKKQHEVLVKKEVNAQRKVKKEQEPVEKRQKMWKLIRQTGPAIELPEDSEHSEVPKHEDSVVKKDTKKDKRLMEAFTPQKKQKDRAIDYRLVLVF